MRNYFTGEKGISLVLTLIMLVVVGVLSAALLSSTVHNIRFGVSEVDLTRALYGAEAGVEYTQTAFRELALNGGLSEIDDYDPESDDVYLISAGGNDDGDHFAVVGDDISSEYDAHKSLDENGDLEFVVEMIENGDDVTFASRGHVNGYTREIEFSFDMDLFLEAAVLLNLSDPDEKKFDDYVTWSGGEGEFRKEHVKFADIYDIVGVDNWWEFIDVDTGGEGYVDVDLDDNTVDDYLDFMPVSDIERVTGGGMEELKDDYMDHDGGDGGVKEEGKEHPEGFESKIYFTNSPLQIGDYLEPDWPEEDSEKDDFPGYDYVEDEYQLIYYENDYYTLEDDLLSFEDSTHDDWSKYEEEYAPSDDSDYWDWFDPEDTDHDFDHRGDITIQNSIFIVDGSLSNLGNVTLKDSLVLVRRNVEIGGHTDLDNSLILAFNDWADDTEDQTLDNLLTVTGANSIRLDLLEPPANEGWVYMDDILEELGDSAADYTMQFWRQTK